MSITPSQCRAARGLVELDQADLATKASISRNVVVDFENGRRTPTTNNLAAIRSAFESAGVEFIPENGGGAGVRFRKPHPAAAGAKKDKVLDAPPVDTEDGRERDLDPMATDASDGADEKPSPRRALRQMKDAIARDAQRGKKP